jgi:hypothetical protein
VLSFNDDIRGSDSKHQAKTDKKTEVNQKDEENDLVVLEE